MWPIACFAASSPNAARKFEANVCRVTSCISAISASFLIRCQAFRHRGGATGPFSGCPRNNLRNRGVIVTCLSPTFETSGDT